MGFVPQGTGLVLIERKGVPENAERTTHLKTGKIPVWFFYSEY